MRGCVCRLQLLLALAIAVILRSESRGTHDHILLSQIQDSPKLEDQVPMFISQRNRVAQLYPQELGALCVASDDSQGYGGGIWPCCHTGLLLHSTADSNQVKVRVKVTLTEHQFTSSLLFFLPLRANRTENIVPINSSVVAYLLPRKLVYRAIA
jgi:hypothetical protein